MRKAFRMVTLVAVALGAFATGMVAQESSSWVHIRVAEADGANASLDLPVSLVGMAMQMAAGAEGDRAGLEFGGAGDLDLQDLRRIWSDLSAGGDMEYVNVEEGGERVRVFREGDRVHIEADEADGASVRVRVPASVIDVLLGSEGDRLDIVGALEELARAGNEEVMEIVEGERSVRLWVDNQGG